MHDFICMLMRWVVIWKFHYEISDRQDYNFKTYNYRLISKPSPAVQGIIAPTVMTNHFLNSPFYMANCCLPICYDRRFDKSWISSKNVSNHWELGHSGSWFRTQETCYGTDSSWTWEFSGGVVYNGPHYMDKKGPFNGCPYRPTDPFHQIKLFKR